jgi:predicted methyltransferase
MEKQYMRNNKYIKTGSFLLILLLIFILFVSGCADRKTGSAADVSPAQPKPSQVKPTVNNTVVPFSKLSPDGKKNTSKYIYAEPLSNIQIVTEKEQLTSLKNGALFVPIIRSVTADMIVKEMKVNTGDSFADIGSGLGHFVFPISDALGAQGKLYSVEANLSCLLYQMQLHRKMTAKHPDKFNNIIFKYDTWENLMLPENSLDHAILVGVHNYFFAEQSAINEYKKAHPDINVENIPVEIIHKEQKKFTESMKLALKPDGNLGIIEPVVRGLGGNQNSNITMNKTQVINLMTKKFGFKFVKCIELPDYEFFIFENSK